MTSKIRNLWSIFKFVPIQKRGHNGCLHLGWAFNVMAPSVKCPRGFYHGWCWECGQESSLRGISYPDRRRPPPCCPGSPQPLAVGCVPKPPRPSTPHLSFHALPFVFLMHQLLCLRIRKSTPTLRLGERYWHLVARFFKESNPY